MEEQKLKLVKLSLMRTGFILNIVGASNLFLLYCAVIVKMGVLMDRSETTHQGCAHTEWQWELLSDICAFYLALTNKYQTLVSFFLSLVGYFVMEAIWSLNAPILCVEITQHSGSNKHTPAEHLTLTMWHFCSWYHEHFSSNCHTISWYIRVRNY